MTALIINSATDIRRVVSEQADSMDFGSGSVSDAIASVTSEIQGREHPDYGADWQEFFDGISIVGLLSEHQEF